MGRQLPRYCSAGEQLDSWRELVVLQLPYAVVAVPIDNVASAELELELELGGELVEGCAVDVGLVELADAFVVAVHATVAQAAAVAVAGLQSAVAGLRSAVAGAS